VSSPVTQFGDPDGHVFVVPLESQSTSETSLVQVLQLRELTGKK